MYLMIQLDPSKEQSHNVVGDNACPTCIHDQLHEKFAFLLRIRFVPLPKCLANKCQVLVARDSPLYLITESIQSCHYTVTFACVQAHPSCCLDICVKNSTW